MAILPDLSQKSNAELRAMIERMAEANAKKLSLKVSAKGGVQLNGLRRFPVTFYAGEWEVILGMADDIRKFIAANKSVLATKGDAE